MLDLLDEQFGPHYEAHIKARSKFPEVCDYARTLVEGVMDNRDTLDGFIRSVARNWKLQRMATLDRNVLRIAIYEMIMRKDIPAKVAINEAVEMGKRYGDSDSGAFVNGILDRIRIENEAGTLLPK